jgi:hypothetical protein
MATLGFGGGALIASPLSVWPTNQMPAINDDVPIGHRTNGAETFMQAAS